MAKNKAVVTDIKDFYYQLETILEDYYDKTLDNTQAMKKIFDLKKAAIDAGIQVNINDSILSNITPSSSYTSSYGC